MIIKVLAVGCGGFFGCICRFFISHIAYNSSYTGKLPLGTLIANISGCFIIGLLGAYFQNRHPNAEWMIPLLITGFLGGMTTFSSFGIESLNLFQVGFPALALLNIAMQVILSMMAVTIGFHIVQAFFQ